MPPYKVDVLVLMLLVLLPSSGAQGNTSDELGLVQTALHTEAVGKSAVFDFAVPKVQLQAHVHSSWAQFYESLLPEDADLAKERKMWKGSPSGVHVIEEHGQALHWWLRSAISNARAHQMEEQKRRLLLHVDSHEDIGVDTWDDVPRWRGRLGRPALAQFMSREAGFGNFIAAGVAAGLISDMVWLRSHFRNSTYNGPSHGLYKVGLFLTNGGRRVCQMIISTGRDDAGKRERERRDDVLNIKVGEFNTCDELEIQKKVRNPFATFNLLVTDLPHFQQDFERFLARSHMIPIAEWWLDVDEDYFATYIPGWHNLVDSLRADFEAEHLLRIRKVLSRLHAACGEKHDLQLIKMVQSLPWQKQGRWKRLKCHVKKELKQELMYMTSDFSTQQRKAWKKGVRSLYKNDYLGDDVYTIFDADGGMPEGLPSTKELARTFSLFEGSLQHVVKHVGRPQVLTACRSILNGYLPHKLWPFIEPRLHDALRRILGDPELRMVPDVANPSTKLYAGME